MATHSILLRDLGDNYAPPERVMEVVLVGERLFLRPMTVVETFDESTYIGETDSFQIDATELVAYLSVWLERDGVLPE